MLILIVPAGGGGGLRGPPINFFVIAPTVIIFPPSGFLTFLQLKKESIGTIVGRCAAASRHLLKASSGGLTFRHRLIRSKKVFG